MVKSWIFLAIALLGMAVHANNQRHELGNKHEMDEFDEKRDKNLAEKHKMDESDEKLDKNWAERHKFDDEKRRSNWTAKVAAKDAAEEADEKKQAKDKAEAADRKKQPRNNGKEAVDEKRDKNWTEKHKTDEYDEKRERNWPEKHKMDEYDEKRERNWTEKHKTDESDKKRDKNWPEKHKTDEFDEKRERNWTEKHKMDESDEKRDKNWTEKHKMDEFDEKRDKNWPEKHKMDEFDEKRERNWTEKHKMDEFDEKRERNWTERRKFDDEKRRSNWTAKAEAKDAAKEADEKKQAKDGDEKKQPRNNGKDANGKEAVDEKKKPQNKGKQNDAKGKQAEEELLFVHAVWRHGEVQAPYDFLHPGSEGLRESIPKGLIEMFQLGQLLKKRYIDDQPFLDPDRVSQEIYIQSIDYNRSLSGAAAMLAGMYPVKNRMLNSVPGWPSNWMPIPVHSVPLDQDIELNMGTRCPTFDQAYNNLANISAYAKILRQNQDFYDYLSKRTGMKVDRKNVGLIWASTTPQWNEKSEIPRWVNDSLLEKMRYLSELDLHYRMRNKTMVRLRGGPLLTNIFNRMEAKWEAMMNKTIGMESIYFDSKYYGYSSRGMPILWQLAGLGVFEWTNDSVPYFASCLTYELWNRSGKAYVSVNYFDPINGFSPVQVPACPKLPARCPLDIMRKTASAFFITPNQWYKECDADNPFIRMATSPATSSAKTGSYQSLATIFGIIIIVLTLFIVIQMCVLMRPKKRDGYSTLDERTQLISTDIK